MNSFAPLLVIFFLSKGPLVNELPADPHLFFNDQSRCLECHMADEDGITVLEHEFVIDIVESCKTCHMEEKLGRSHPVLIETEEKYPNMEVPDILPLDIEERITCGTCHNPHLDGLSTSSFSKLQEPFLLLYKSREEVPYYKTYYLRIAGEGEGFTPLCNACHKEY